MIATISFFCRATAEDALSYLDKGQYSKAVATYNRLYEHADFSPVTKEWLKGDKIIHKARIQVNEEGTRAAAITSFPMVGAAFIEEELIFDRPFIYAIMNNTTGLPAFAGIVKNL